MVQILMRTTKSTSSEVAFVNVNGKKAKLMGTAMVLVVGEYQH